MIDALRRRWRELAASEPGHRFQERWERSRREGESRTRRVLTFGGGVALLLAGIFFLPAPGPGMAIVALGAALLARESHHVARVLDAAEVKGRAAWGWARDRWARAGTAARAAAVVLAGVVAAAGGWAAWRIFFG